MTITTPSPLRGEILPVEVQHASEAFQSILARCPLGVVGVAGREAGVDQNGRAVLGLDRIPLNADDAVVLVHLEQAVVEHRRRAVPAAIGSSESIMKVTPHTLFEYLLETTATKPEAVLGFSLAAPPTLGEYLSDLDPGLSLDWSNESFQGTVALREHVLARANRADICVPDDVVITAGAAEANFLAISQLVQPGDEIVVEEPGWPQPFVLAEAIGATIRVVHRHEADAWRFDPVELAGLVSERTRMIFLCNPNNPTGQVLTEPELAEVVRIADRVGAYVLCDEVYAGLEWDGPRQPSIVRLYERGIGTGSVSKTLGLQGLRIGWLIVRDATVVADAVVLRENTSEIMNVMGEAIAEIALRSDRYQRALERARFDGLSNLDALDAYITSRPELAWQRPPAGLIGLCRLDLPIDGETLARRLLEPPYRTFLIPGSAYNCPQHIRLGVGGGAAVELETGLDRLSRFLDDYGSGVKSSV